MPFACLNGLRLHYELYGAGEPLVFVHGYTGDGEDWLHQVDWFSGDHRVLVFDNRGHGASEACADREGYSVDHLVADAVGMIETVGFDRFHLVGHSMGGAVAQEIALRWPDRLISLTLQATSHWFGDHAEPGGTPPQVSQEEVEIAVAHVARMSKDALAGAWKGLLGWPGSTDRAHQIAVPTLVIHGDRDASRIIEGSRRLCELIPHAKHVVIEGAGHSPQRERPREFNLALEAFLRSASDRPAP